MELIFCRRLIFLTSPILFLVVLCAVIVRKVLSVHELIRTPWRSSAARSAQRHAHGGTSGVCAGYTVYPSPLQAAIAVFGNALRLPSPVYDLAIPHPGPLPCSYHFKRMLVPARAPCVKPPPSSVHGSRIRNDSPAIGPSRSGRPTTALDRFLPRSHATWI